jgi:hypothetical protein
MDPTKKWRAPMANSRQEERTFGVADRVAGGRELYRQEAGTSWFRNDTIKSVRT